MLAIVEILDYRKHVDDAMCRLLQDRSSEDSIVENLDERRARQKTTELPLR